jgi:hypothetical protein
VSSNHPADAARAASGSWRDYLELGKPRVVALIVFTAVVGMVLAAPGLPPLAPVVFGTLGIALAATSAAVINHVLDRHYDQKMARTRHRPIPTGHVSAYRALAYAALLGASPLQAQSPAASCESLASLALPNTAITLAETVVPGAFTPPAAGNRQGGGLAPATPPARGAGAGPGGGRGAAPARGRVTLASAGLGLGYNGGRTNAAFSELPAFCRVAVTLTPTATSDIRAEVWLPLWGGERAATLDEIAYLFAEGPLLDGELVRRMVAASV